MKIAGNIAAGVILLALGMPAHAAKAPLSPEKLKKQAAHIVTGEVLSVTKKDQKSKVETGFGTHRDRIFTIKLKVNSVAKGTGLKEGDEIVIEAWKPIRRFPPEPGLQGHEKIPAKGDRITAYLEKQGGKDIFEPLLPNGIAVQSEK